MAPLIFFCEATTTGRAVEGGECGASWFVGQVSRCLDDGLQITGMVRVEHLARRLKHMDAFDFWEWAQSWRRQRRQRWQRPSEGQRPQRSKTAGNEAAKIPGLPFHVRSLSSRVVNYEGMLTCTGLLRFFSRFAGG